MKKVLNIITVTILSILIVLVILAIFLFFKSKIWEREFQSNINPDFLVSDSTLSEDFNQRVEKYILSDDNTEFLSLSPQEVGHTIFGSLAQMVAESNLEITNVYVEPNETVWMVCARTRLKDVRNLYAWVCTDITKDDMQTAQIYLSNLEVHGINVSDIYPKSLTMINQGIAEALVTANENGFVGRVFENIELLEEELIIKGSRY
jgi:hypothetical protein